MTMSRPNELAEPLNLAEVGGPWPSEGSLCSLTLKDQRGDLIKRERPAMLILEGRGFEATRLLSHADLVAIRDWTAKAIAALEAARPELIDA